MSRLIQRPVLWAGLLGLGVHVGCAEDASPEGRPLAVQAKSAPATTADPGLCADHGVLSSVCTKCNPRLAPVFQAKGDWCAEHGFPESFCPICSPEAGGRPVVPSAGESGAPAAEPGAPAAGSGAPADGTVVRFRTRAVADQAGLELVVAQETDWVEGTEAVARIAWDATRMAAVSARASGVVQSIRADVGDRVEAGQILADLRSVQVSGDRARAVAARQAREVAAAEVERKAELLAGGVGSRRELLSAEQALAAAEAELGAVEAELAAVGGGAGDRSVIVSPLSGVVTARKVAVGEATDGQQVLFEVVDPSQVWAEVDIAERDLGPVAVGQPVRVRLDALPDQAFQGTIAAISPAVDPLTRTARARVVLDNADGRLRANQYGTATLLGQTAAAAVVVPAAALQRAGEIWLVFVRQEVDRYVARRVRVLARQGDRVRIAGGVRAGDSVVTTGSFLLKTETLKDSIGAGCCDVE